LSSGYGQVHSHAVGYHAIEVWNGHWHRLNAMALSFWEDRLRARQHIVALGGSDTHRLKSADRDARQAPHLGCPTTWARVGSDRSTAGVLGALRSGNAFISRGPDGPQVYLDWRPDGVRVHAVGARRAVLLLITEAGVVSAHAIDRDDWRESMRLSEAFRYVRAELMDEHSQMLALTNPRYGPGLT
jgi:hypothetical protein